MSGEEFVKQWTGRIQNPLNKPDIIFCSALQEGALRVSAAQLALADYRDRIHFLPKPFRLDEFERLIHKIDTLRDERVKAA